MEDTIDGIVLVNKPAGPTSHDIVDCIRRRFKIKKAGHAGTLDPFAEGLLVILIGSATKRQREFLNCDKEYRVTIRLGISTDTGDRLGQVTFHSEAYPGRDAVEGVLAQFTGVIVQDIPMYSAVKFKGRPLYALARKNITVALPPRTVEIKSIEILHFEAPLLELVIRSSKGTYIRQLCRDIGEKLGCGGHAESLTRTASGNFKLCDSVAYKELSTMSREDLVKIIRN